MPKFGCLSSYPIALLLIRPPLDSIKPVTHLSFLSADFCLIFVLIGSDEVFVLGCRSIPTTTSEPLNLYLAMNYLDRFLSIVYSICKNLEICIGSMLTVSS